MKWVAVNFKGQWRDIVLGPLFKLVEAVLELYVPLVMAGMIDVGIRTRDTAYILRGGGLLLLLAVLGALASFACQYYAARTDARFGRRLRGQLFEHVMHFSAPETALFGAGGLITRLTNDVNQMQAGVNMAIRLGTRVPFLVIGSLLMALVLNRRMGLVFLAAAVLISLVLALVVYGTLPGYGKIQAGQDRLSRLSAESLEGMRVIRAFSRQRQEKEEFETEGEALAALQVRVGRLSLALNPLTTLIANLAVLVIVRLGAGYVFAGSMQPGEIIALVSYMNQILLALLVAANLVVLFTRAAASARRVALVLATQPSITGGAGARAAPEAPAVEMERVCYAYPQGAGCALEDISFTLARGQTLGIIGGTGSGKTTLANLLLRYFDPTGGSVRINGAPARDYTLPALRAKIGLVPQKATLFTGSVRYNLNMGALPGTTPDDAALWRALDLAQAGFVRELPGGLDAEIAEGAANLSGGQRQRLALARALVRRPEILILDDAASALDAATEAALRRALREESARRAGAGHPLTLVLISQRAAALRHADCIAVMEDGRIAAMGTHEQLLAAGGVYHEICVSQGVETGEARE